MQPECGYFMVDLSALTICQKVCISMENCSKTDIISGFQSGFGLVTYLIE